MSSVMAVLAWVPRLLVLHLVWVVIVLAGAVVGGLAPATVVLVAELREGADDGPAARTRRVLDRLRAEAVAANLAAGPFVLIALAAGTNLVLGVAGALPAPFVPVGLPLAALLGVLATLGAAHAVALRVLRPEAPAPLIWRGALAGPVLLPVATASWTITLLATAAASAVIQPLGLLLGGGILVAVTTHVLTRAWQLRLERALAPSRVPAPAEAPVPARAAQAGR